VAGRKASAAGASMDACSSRSVNSALCRSLSPLRPASIHTDSTPIEEEVTGGAMPTSPPQLARSSPTCAVRGRRRPSQQDRKPP
jgi:hypothetical protein